MARPKLKFHEWRGVVVTSGLVKHRIINHAFNMYAPQGSGLLLDMTSLCGVQFHALNSPAYGEGCHTCPTCRQLLPAAEKRELEKQRRAFARENPCRLKLIAEIKAILPDLWAFDLREILTQAKIDKKLADDRRF